MLAILRIVAGAVFITFGTMKLFNAPPMPSGMPPIALMSQLGMAALLETFGGLAIVLGFLVRPVAFVLAGEMGVAYFTAHFPRSVFPSVNMGAPAVLYCFIYLYFAVAGAPVWSIDAMIARSKAAPPG
jgi:putative oxidoreductase